MDIFDITIGTFLGNGLLLLALYGLEEYLKKPAPKKRVKEPRINSAGH